MVWAGVSKHHKTKWELNCSSLSIRSTGYGGHSIVEKTQRNAAAARWRSSPSGKGLNCISEYNQHKRRWLSLQITRLEHNWNHLGWTKPQCKENRGYSNHTKSTESKYSIRVEQPSSELRSALCRVNETPLSCVVNRAGTNLLLSLHGHERRCRSWLKNIVIFTLFCDIFDQVWSLLKYWKNVNFVFTINLNLLLHFVTFYSIRNKINAILLHRCLLYLLKIWK